MVVFKDATCLSENIIPRKSSAALVSHPRNNNILSTLNIGVGSRVCNTNFMDEYYLVFLNGLTVMGPYDI